MATDPSFASPPSPAEQRLQAYLAAGYDPLTAPVDWFRQARIEGAARPLTSVPTAPAAIASALAWAEANGSTAVVVSVDGETLVERYWHGDGRDTRFNAQSMAKTVAALMVGIALDRREIESVDDPVGRYLREWRDDPRGSITLRQLLQMASGLGQVDAGWGMKLVPQNPAVEAYFGDDFLTPALRLPAATAPGSRFDYNNDNIRIVAAVLERQAGKRYVELLSERLWKPLGLGDAGINVDAQGFAYASANLFARPVDWLAIGELILNRGERDGQRVVSSRWIEEMARPSPTNPAYGFWLWLGDQQVGGPPVPPVLTPWQSERFKDPNTLILNGFGGQRVWVLPSRRMVIVRAGRTWPAQWDDSRLPNLLWEALR